MESSYISDLELNNREVPENQINMDVSRQKFFFQDNLTHIALYYTHWSYSCFDLSKRMNAHNLQTSTIQPTEHEVSSPEIKLRDDN